MTFAKRGENIVIVNIIAMFCLEKYKILIYGGEKTKFKALLLFYFLMLENPFHL